jgi:hypothetical protein
VSAAPRRAGNQVGDPVRPTFLTMDNTVVRLMAAIEEFESVRAERAALPERHARRALPPELTELELTLLDAREAEADQAIISALCDVKAEEHHEELDLGSLAFLPRAV